MKNLSAVTGLILLGLAAIIGLMLFGQSAQAAPSQSDLLVRAYFAGAPKIAAAPNANVLTNEFTSPEALALRNQLAAKLSVWLAGSLAANPNQPTPGGAAKLRPLIDDLQQSEFLLEIHATTGRPETAIAIKLPPARAQLWQANLNPFFAKGTFKTSADWLVFDSDPTQLRLGEKVTKDLNNLPTDWFTLDINWPRLAQWHPQFKDLGLPETQLAVSPVGSELKVMGKLTFPDKLALKLDPWEIPTNTIHAPFDSFTAIRGFSAWLQAQPWASPFQLSPSPNELFVWALPGAVFPTYAAVPVPNGAAAISQTEQHWRTALDEARANNELMPSPKPIQAELKGNEISVVNVPFASVRAQALTEPAGQFLLAELFPNPPAGLPLPQGLLNRLNTKNLVYYHWETTTNRVPQLLQITQLSLLLTNHKQLDGKSAAYKWLRKASAVKGASETGITQSGPAEFTLLRQGPGLFTAFELFALANWFESPNFPGFELTLVPPLPDSDTPAPAAPAKAPAPKASH
jgi:hypothetical protein